MKKTYRIPELLVFPVNFPDLLTLSNGGEGVNGMLADWENEVYR